MMDNRQRTRELCQGLIKAGFVAQESLVAFSVLVLEDKPKTDLLEDLFINLGYKTTKAYIRDGTVTTTYLYIYASLYVYTENGMEIQPKLHLRITRL